MFIGRERELAQLNKLYHTDFFQFPVIYGRRRVGKTAIINEFITKNNLIINVLFNLFYLRNIFFFSTMSTKDIPRSCP